MGGVASDQTTGICGHCGRAIPVANIDLHHAHCYRNLEKCRFCDDMILKDHADEHFLKTHAKVSCSICGEIIDRNTLSIHKKENCPLRIISCMFCNYPLPAIDLPEHQEVCGNRTKLCPMCNRYIRLREQIHHASQCSRIADPSLTSEPTRDASAADNERDHNARAADDERDPNISGSMNSLGQLVLSIAMVGIAVLLSGLLSKRK